MDAATGRITGIGGARIAVVAVFKLTGAAPPRTGIACGAGIAIITADGIRRVHAANGQIAGVIGADVAIVAAQERA
jgi:hypothetical protein